MAAAMFREAHASLLVLVGKVGASAGTVEKWTDRLNLVRSATLRALRPLSAGISVSGASDANIPGRRRLNISTAVAKCGRR